MHQAQGLYRPQFEHDACGVGFVANLNAHASHTIIEQGIKILRNLEHRGASGCDAATGDGAGILIQIPDAFERKVCEGLEIDLPGPGHYATGLVFLPPNGAEAEQCRQIVESVVEREGQRFLGWREVPVDSASIGEFARRVEPKVWQVFVGRSPKVATARDFERKLWIIHRWATHLVRQSGLRQHVYFHIPSLSSKTLVYKGLLLADQIDRYFPDLLDETMVSAMALVHQRYSTNTAPSWDRAQPFRYLAHNGEINTLRGNINWMHAREQHLESELVPEIDRLFPIINPDQSDSACLDNALELLIQTGRSLQHCISMLIPEAWEHHATMSDTKRAFYEYNSCLMEPWDGPAAICFTDGRVIGSVLDRNGLRPLRWLSTRDGLVVMASEAGVLDIPQDQIERKGRIQPGRMFLCDLEAGRIVSDDEIKERLARRHPYRAWLDRQMMHLDKLPDPAPELARNDLVEAEPDLTRRQRAFGYTLEDTNLLITPMATDGKEVLGSMGNDAALAVMSDKPRMLYDYFKQLFAQVTNPPLDAIREELVTSLLTHTGREGNLFIHTPEHVDIVRIERPILTDRELERLRRIDHPRLRSITLPILFDAAKGPAGMERAMERLGESAHQAIEDGFNTIVLSDRGVNRERAPIPALLAVAGVHHRLIREGSRVKVGLILESGEPREVHHFCALLGFGCGMINPYLALETVENLRQEGRLGELTAEKAADNYVHAACAGVLKVMSKMGISTLQSYRGAQIFEAIGLGQALVDKYFTWTATRIGGLGIAEVAREALLRHAAAYPAREIPETPGLDVGGQYQWRRDGERHMFNPFTISALQESVRGNSYASWEEFSRLVNDDARSRCTLRSFLQFKEAAEPVAIEEVEPAKEIVKRFKTGAMSFGSISRETHETLAVAMNRLGGKSNTGEGGEDPDRYHDERCSAIKQVASGRFGVTIEYLASAREIQIKMAQGAKPGEGGQLPGHKVDDYVGRIRHSTPGVGLISPPPHHDIYSIEDLAQLIHDLKNSNPGARVSVKLVSEAGVGTIAAGVAKGKADVVLISGHDGGTGASPLTSIKHAGLPWELGLAEAHQTLLMNDLRSRIRVETDGQLKTGRDVAIAALLGAEEFGFSTAPLVALGCIMMRKCHLNTCPVGIATQDPELRKKFAGKPEHVINYFFFVAEELRQIMARLGVRTIEQMVGRTDLLAPDVPADHWKLRTLDLAPLLHRPPVPETYCTYQEISQNHGLERALDNELIRLAEPAIADGIPVRIDLPVNNTNRTVGTMLSHTVARRRDGRPLADDTIHIKLTGSAGQSVGAFGVTGLTIEIEGDANDYFGKGLSGARLIIRPPRNAGFNAEENVIIGNVGFYGATGGEAFVRGIGGERCCVRNSGANIVIEGVGDHGCEYMTGGRAIILGGTGRNFGAGMSGGIAYVLDRAGAFDKLCNLEMIGCEGLADDTEAEWVRSMIERHRQYTSSTVAMMVLDQWDFFREKFVRVIPHEYKKVLERKKQSVEVA